MDWTFIGATAALMIIPVTVIIGWLTIRSQRRADGRLDYEVISATRLVAREASGLETRLRVTYDGDILEDPYLSLLRVINSGPKDISKEDFKGESYKFQFDRPVRLATITKTSHDQLTASTVRFNGSEVYLLPTLFKQNEWLVVAVLTTGRPTLESVDFRVANIALPSELEQTIFSQITSPIAIVGWLAAAQGWIAAVIVSYLFSRSTENINNMLISQLADKELTIQTFAAFTLKIIDERYRFYNPAVMAYGILVATTLVSSFVAWLLIRRNRGRRTLVPKTF